MPETAQKQVQMVDALNPEFKNLGQVMQPVFRQSTAATFEEPYPDYDALAIPDGLEKQAELLENLLRLCSEHMRGTFSAENIAKMLDMMRKTKPDPVKDPKGFAHALRGSCHGWLEMLRLLVVLKSKDPVKAGQAFAMLSQSDNSTGVPRFPSELVGKQRDAYFHPRVENLRAAVNNVPPGRAIRNQVLDQTLRQQFPQAASLIQLASDMVLKFATTDYARAQWMNAFLENLNKFLEGKNAEDEAVKTRITSTQTALGKKDLTKEMMMKIFNDVGLTVH